MSELVKVNDVQDIEVDKFRHSDTTKMKFATWLAHPSDLRQPKTQGEWAAQNGVSIATCWRWKNNPEFRQLVNDRIRGWFVDAMPDVVQSVIDQAKSGSAKHSELIFRHVAQMWSQDEEVKSEKKTDHGQALMAAFQSGRLQEQLAAVVQAGQREIARQKESINGAVIDADFKEKNVK